MAGLDYDVAVIGSGFGGSVAALRLTEKGYRVAVLEARQRFDDPSRDAPLDRAPGRPGRRPGRAARASVAGPPAPPGRALGRGLTGCVITTPGRANEMHGLRSWG